MVKLVVEPLHPLPDGVTMIVAVCAVVPLLMAVNEAMLPIPVAGNPIDGLLFVQL
jgi:hypothetical protein